MNVKKRKLTILLCLIPILLSCSSQIEGQKAKTSIRIPQEQNEADVNEQMISISIKVPESVDPGLYLYENPTTRLDVVDFYNNITGQDIITHAIIKNAKKYEIPLSLAFALAYGESDFNKWAVNKNPTSIDRGLYQLNSTTFPELTEVEFFNPEVNADYGLRYFRWCLDQGTNDIVGLAIYNAGLSRVQFSGVPRITLEHINNIIDYRTRVDIDFMDWMNSNN